MVPSAHQPALFLIQEGILFSAELKEFVCGETIRISFGSNILIQ